MGDKPIQDAEKTAKKPTEIPIAPAEAEESPLNDFARALTWTKQAFQLQQSVIENEKSIIINYPDGKGSATIFKDADGVQKVFQ